MGPRPATAVLVPVKAFAAAKVRLAPALAPAERASLARSMAEQVVRAAAPMPVAVVCDDPAVAAWAAGLGAGVVWTPRRGLNAAVTEGVARLAAGGVTTATVVHADLPLLDRLGEVGRPGSVTIAPDRRQDGTNLITVPADVGFDFSYGPGSFGRHRQEAERLGLPVVVLDRADLAWDVDVPDDLSAVGAVTPSRTVGAAHRGRPRR